MIDEPAVARPAPPDDLEARRNFKDELRRRESRAEQRRGRYRDDPAYRAACIARASRWMRRTRRGAKRGTGGWREVLVRHGSETRRLRVGTTATLAAALGRGKDAIASWERTGVLPAPAFVTAGGWRLYTEDQVAAAADAYRVAGMARATRENHGYRPPALILFAAIVAERWALLGQGAGDWRLAAESEP